jgi:pilus assembly protein CpaE
VALNTAAAIQRLGSKVLLADFDFHNSVLAFWLKLAPRHGLQEALERAHSLDPALWKSMVHPYEGLDILTSPQGTSPAAFSGAETDALLHFAARHYEFVLVDLPEALYTSCWGMIERAKLVLLVTTPEMASLYLARRKASDLVNHGISRERLRVVLNRCSKIDVSADEVEKFLTIPVLASLSNQYRAVTGAFAGGRHVPESSKLGEEIAVLANAIAGALPRTKEKPSPIKMLRRILSPA